MTDDDFRTTVLAELAALRTDAAAAKEFTTKIWLRVDGLEKRATFWGAASGAFAILATKLLGGCL
jgi:hypothetical protein